MSRALGLAARPLNPVLARELRQRMRGGRAAAVITVYLLVLVGILALIYTALGQADTGSGPRAEDIALLGRSIFQTLLFFVLVLVCFIVPAISASAIAGERERQTLVPLQLTLLSPVQILVGKLLASLAFVALLVVAALPLLGVSFLFGGVEAAEAFRATAMVLVVAVLLASVSLACSSVFRRTAAATVMAYAVVLFLLFGTFVLFGAQLLLQREGPQAKTQLVLMANPVMAVASTLDTPEDGFDFEGFSPFIPFQALIATRDDPPDQWFGVVLDDGSGEVVGDRFEPNALNQLPFWIPSLGAMATVCAASLALAARRLALPRSDP